MKILISIFGAFLFIGGCEDSSTNNLNQNNEYGVAYFTDALDSLYIVKLDNINVTTKVKFSYRGSSVDWIPNSSELVYSDYTSNHISQVFRFDCVAGKNQLLFTITNTAITTLKVSPDGKNIACNGYDVNGLGSKIAIFTFANSSLKTLTQLSEKTYFLQWSPDNRSILANKYYDSTFPYTHLYSIDIETASQQMLSNQRIQAVSFSPDGSKIAFSEYDSLAYSALGIMNANGSNKHFVTSYSFSLLDPVWSPDGKMIAFLKNDSQYVNKLHLLNVNDLSIKQLSTAPAVHFYPHWIDNNRISFYSNGLHNLCAVNKDGTGFSQVTYLNDLQSGSRFIYAVSKNAF